MYPKYYTGPRYVVCIYFLPVCSVLFHPLHIEQKLKILKEFVLSVFLSMAYAFGVKSRYSLLNH